MIQKRIFKFHDGTKDRAVDPVLVDLRFDKAARGLDIEAIKANYLGPEWMDKVDENGQVNVEGIDERGVATAFKLQTDAILELTPVLYEAFGCCAVGDDGDGTTIAEILKIWADFLAFKFDVKKNTDDGQNLSSPMDSIQTISPSPTIPTLYPPGDQVIPISASPSVVTNSSTALNSTSPAFKHLPPSPWHKESGPSSETPRT